MSRRADAGYDGEVPVVAVSSDGSAEGETAARVALRATAGRNIVVGALWCVGGILVTSLSYSAAANSPTGGHYFMAWGAILFGGIQFFKGLAKLGG